MTTFVTAHGLLPLAIRTGEVGREIEGPRGEHPIDNISPE